MEDPPIACTLASAELTDRLEDWAAVLADATRERTSPTLLRLGFEPTTDVARLVELARLEKECCGFFRFRLEIETGSLTLAVEVPPSAVGTLDGFERL